MEFFDAVAERRSVRVYSDEAVPEVVMEKALDAALLAPNSSNMQPWEFYWVRSPEQKAALVKACFSQSAARTAQELVVCVARADTWKRNRKLMLDELRAEAKPVGPPQRKVYYEKLVPMMYFQDWFGIAGVVKWLAFTVLGLFRPVPRGPYSRKDLFNVLHKTTALACENFMLAISAQGFATCPMEGFDEKLVKRLLKLNRNASVTMVISVGRAVPRGIWGDRVRFSRELFVHKV